MKHDTWIIVTFCCCNYKLTSQLFFELLIDTQLFCVQIDIAISLILFTEPKKRQVWLKVWFSQLEAAELENYEAFELTEENEHETDVIDEDIVFRLPTADEIADASRAVDRKISSTSSTCSTSSYQSSTYEG
jgi:hypothetical protein